MTTTARHIVRFYFSEPNETAVGENPLRERVADKNWKAALDRWREALRAVRHGERYGDGRGSSYLASVVPAPMPWGHIMFDRRRNSYRGCKLHEKPEPMWSDGVACLYAGQRVAWSVQIGSQPIQWFYGEAIGVDDESGDIIIRRHDGGICQRSPYSID